MNRSVVKAYLVFDGSGRDPNHGLALIRIIRITLPQITLICTMLTVSVDQSIHRHDEANRHFGHFLSTIRELPPLAHLRSRPARS